MHRIGLTCRKVKGGSVGVWLVVFKCRGTSSDLAEIPRAAPSPVPLLQQQGCAVEIARR
jgi:hypothetical protein